ncbi:uncharacterized protein PFLUO_LOCUS2819 [Penicillium psychrofluorescens]|uniref:uncharacterized protein n=1 Tax=Penicillium psychrofluorescens TaxID=3158075 RepID=UPI003CCE1BB4
MGDKIGATIVSDGYALIAADIEKGKDIALLPETLKKEEAKTISMLNELGAIRDRALPQGNRWIFGTEMATALDSHLMIFLARLMDVGRESLMPETIRYYAEAIMAQDVWKDFMQGRTTMYQY